MWFSDMIGLTCAQYISKYHPLTFICTTLGCKNKLPIAKYTIFILYFGFLQTDQLFPSNTKSFLTSELSEEFLNKAKLTETLLKYHWLIIYVQFYAMDRCQPCWG